MHDTGFQVFIWLIFGVVAVGFVVMFVLAIAHVAMFGTVFGMAVKRIQEFQARTSQRHARQRCRHCKSFVSVRVAECPNCGAPTA